MTHIKALKKRLLRGTILKGRCHMRRGIHVSHEEEDTCMSYEEEDTCMSYEEGDTCVT
jgi:hypothetical protein